MARVKTVEYNEPMRTMMFKLGLIIVGFTTSQPSYALSTITQLTRTNSHNFPSIKIKVSDEGNDHKHFTVRLIAEKDLYRSDSINGSLEVRKGEELIARSSVSGTRPTGLPMMQQSAGVKQTEVVFSFVVKREHIESSKFTLSHSQPDFSRFSDYWFYLRDFIDAQPAGSGTSPTYYPGCTKIFNGQNFDGWEADASTWSIVDGAMHGFAGSSRLAYTKADYGSFRLIFTARMNPVNRDHLGVLFWGDRPQDPSKPKIDNAGWIQFMPPHGAMWDYHPPKHKNLPHEILAPGSRDFTKWSTTEILCNLEKGTMRAAVDGVEIARYTHPSPNERSDPEKRIIAGPIGIFRHGGGASEYRDIYVEENPKEDRLITVR